MTPDNRHQQQKGTSPWGSRPRPPEKQQTPAAPSRPRSLKIRNMILVFFLFAIPLFVLLGGGCTAVFPVFHEFLLWYPDFYEFLFSPNARESYLYSILPMTITYLFPLAMNVVFFYTLKRIINRYNRDGINYEFPSFGFAIICNNIYYISASFIYRLEKVLTSPSVMYVIIISTIFALYLIFKKQSPIPKKNSPPSIFKYIYVGILGLFLLFFNSAIFYSMEIIPAKEYNIMSYFKELTIYFLMASFYLFIMLNAIHYSSMRSNDKNNKEFRSTHIAYSIICSLIIIFASLILAKGSESALNPPLATVAVLGALLAIYLIFGRSRH